MRKIFLMVMIGFAICACNREKAPSDVLSVQCGGYDVNISHPDDQVDTINAVINGDAATLIRVVSASGEKYDGMVNDTNISLWSKGNEWTLILADDMVIDCVAK